MSNKHLSDSRLLALLDNLQRELPKKACIALFVFQNSEEGIITDYISNTKTESMAKTVRFWANGYLAGDIEPAKRGN